MTRLKVVGAEPPPRPTRVALISLTTFCNAHCPFCCVFDILNRPELNPTDEQIRAKMAEARADGCTVLGLTGGEPTVHPHFADICRYGKELGYESITINTNGIRFKNRAWVEEALSAGLSHIDFSVHGDSPELHDAMMARPGAYASFLKGMEHLRELSSRYEVFLGATTVVTSKNAARLSSIAQALIEQGIKTLRFKHCFEGAEGADVSLVARYTEMVAPARAAVLHARSLGASVTVTHFPLCLLGDEVVFATDLTDEDVLSIDRDGAVLLDGRASSHRRESTSVCERCQLAPVCTKLDERYIAVHGESELRPIETRWALESFLSRGLQRHPGEPMQSNVRRVLAGLAPRSKTSHRDPDAHKADLMNIGFISPSFRVLEINWEHEYEMVKLGVPTIMGHLYRLGHHDIEHWDFDAQIYGACATDPNSFTLRQYFDSALVKGFLDGSDDTLRDQTERLLDTLGVTEKAIFGLSVSAVLDRIVNVMALCAMAQCMAKVLKERFPRCTIVMGGLQANPDSLQPGIYKEVMEGCAAIDYAFVGKVEASTLQLFRNIWAGRHDLNRSLNPRIVYRDTDGSVHLSSPTCSGSIDPEVKNMSGLQKGLALHTNIGAAAIAAELEKSGGVFPVSGLARRSDATHKPAPENSVSTDFDRTDLSAEEAGDHPWDEIPAAVPYFDKNLVDQFRYSGAQIMRRFHFNKEHMLKFSRFENNRVVVLPHIFIRGCNAPCGFCSYAYTKIEGEDLAETIAGLRFLSETYNCKNFHFLNTQINSVYKYAEMFCDAIIAEKLDILWSDCCNLRSLDERLLEKLRRAGAMRLVFGVESPEDSMLKMIHKGVDVATVERLISASHALGIWNHVLLIAGMPHETRAKQDRIMDFLERTAPVMDFYSVSSFYLIANSPWGRTPEKFGIARISNPQNLLEDQAFDEVPGGRWESEGLRWAEKKQQIIDSTQRFYRTITRAKGQSRCVAGNIDLYMLMFLYSTLGHDQKSEIVKIYTETAREIFPESEIPSGCSSQTVMAPQRNRFRVNIPCIVGRMNEGDQSALVHIPVDIDVSPNTSDQRGFARSERYTFAWRTPPLEPMAERLTRRDYDRLTETLPSMVHTVTGMLAPFVQALDRRLAPTTAERMAELVALNLPRYKPFTNEGYTVTGPATQRTIAERNLEWSGVLDGSGQGSNTGSGCQTNLP